MVTRTAHHCVMVTRTAHHCVMGCKIVQMWQWAGHRPTKKSYTKSVYFTKRSVSVVRLLHFV